MSVFFLGDPHLGHKNIKNFRTCFGELKDSDDNTQRIISAWENTITKNCIVYVMGDAAFDDEHLTLFKGLKGRKILIKGNHDNLCTTLRQTEVFSEIYGMLRYKKCWLTHCPIHPVEMRKCLANVHGHVHQNSITKKKLFCDPIEDTRYINACIDDVYPRYGRIFMTLDEVKSRLPQ